MAMKCQLAALALQSACLDKLPMFSRGAQRTRFSSSNALQAARTRSAAGTQRAAFVVISLPPKYGRHSVQHAAKDVEPAAGGSAGRGPHPKGAAEMGERGTFRKNAPRSLARSRWFFLECGTTSMTLYKQFLVQIAERQRKHEFSTLAPCSSWLVCTAVYKWHPHVKPRIHGFAGEMLMTAARYFIGISDMQRYWAKSIFPGVVTVYNSEHSNCCQNETLQDDEEAA